MKIMIIGSGGREHALAWKISQSNLVTQVIVAPGNAGVMNLPTSSKVISSLENTTQSWLDLAKKNSIDITIVGPEVPLADGVVDLFRAHNQKIFGPTKKAALLESSKIFAKDFMRQHKIPTAAYESFSDADKAHSYINTQTIPIVIKVDGLAAGKGVVVATTADEAHRAVDTFFTNHTQIVIEEFLTGEEISFIVMVGGKSILALAASQDHKRLLDNDKGPNTGGMGAYSPVPCVTSELHAKIMLEIINPTVAGMENISTPFTGFLYAGLMIDKDGNPKVLEFNARLGDPETQVLMTRLRTDFAKIIKHAIDDDLQNLELDWDNRVAVGVVLAAHGYPDTDRYHDIITNIPQNTETHLVFHAGTIIQNGNLVTNGGRVLCAVGLGNSYQLAQDAAYATAKKIHFTGMQYRTDIGDRVLEKTPL